MKKFSVGDRVAVYNHRGRILGRIDSITNGFLDVSAGSGHAFSPHPKQCRLLKKKERRRIWVSPEYFGSGPYFHRSGDGLPVRTSEDKAWIEFVEVKKK